MHYGNTRSAVDSINAEHWAIIPLGLSVLEL